MAAEAPPTLTWRNHPFVERPWASALVCLAVLVSCWLGWHLLGAAGVGLVLVFILLSLGPYIFPTTYTLGPEGAAERRVWQTRTFRWDDFEGYDVYRDAVQLVLDPHPLRNRVQKGLLLPLSGADRDQLLAVVEHYLPTEGTPT